MRELGKAHQQTLRFQFRKRYNLAPTDPRYLSATMDDILMDHWAWRFDEDPGLVITEDEGFDLDQVLEDFASDDEWEEL